MAYEQAGAARPPPNRSFVLARQTLFARTSKQPEIIPLSGLGPPRCFHRLRSPGELVIIDEAAQEACPPLNKVGKEAVVENPAYFLSGVYQRLFARCPSLCFPEPWSFVGSSGECRGCVVDPAETLAVLR